MTTFHISPSIDPPSLLACASLVRERASETGKTETERRERERESKVNYRRLCLKATQKNTLITIELTCKLGLMSRGVCVTYLWSCSHGELQWVGFTSKQKLNNMVQSKLCLKLLSGCHKAPLLAVGLGSLPPPADSTYEWERNLLDYWISVNMLN